MSAFYCEGVEGGLDGREGFPRRPITTVLFTCVFLICRATNAESDRQTAQLFSYCLLSILIKAAQNRHQQHSAHD